VPTAPQFKLARAGAAAAGQACHQKWKGWLQMGNQCVFAAASRPFARQTAGAGPNADSILLSAMTAWIAWHREISD